MEIYAVKKKEKAVFSSQKKLSSNRMLNKNRL